MKAVRFDVAPDGSIRHFSSESPPPSTALRLVEGLPLPQVSGPGELLIKVKATTVIRDNLTWPELFADPPAHLGNDFAGVVVEVHPDEPQFKVGDEVYGMTNARRGGTWAEFVLVTSEEAYIKPSCLSWEEAAALSLSALTADQALFTHAQLQFGNKEAKNVLVTGATGGVGMFLIRFAAAAGHHVIAVSSSASANETYLRALGANTIISYDELRSLTDLDAVIDTVGGSVLADCWNVVKADGALISIDSSSWNFVDQHKNKKFADGREGVRALFFIVEPSIDSMKRITNAVMKQQLKGLVSHIMPLSDARQAYDLCHSRHAGRGKIVLTL